MSDIVEWPKSHRITEVECLIPDMSGIARQAYGTGAVNAFDPLFDDPTISAKTSCSA